MRLHECKSVQSYLTLDTLASKNGHPAFRTSDFVFRIVIPDQKALNLLLNQ